MKRFIEGEDRSQTALLPASLDDYVAEDNPVRVVEAFVEQLDPAAAAGLRVPPRRPPDVPAITPRCCSSCMSTAI